MRDFLKLIGVIQIRRKRYTWGEFYEMRRLNPYNPLTYITMMYVIVFGIVTFGVYGFWREVDFTNPFKWR